MGRLGFESLVAPGAPGAALHKRRLVVLADQLAVEEFLGSERLHDVVEGRQAQDREAVDGAPHFHGKPEEPADALDMAMGDGCGRLRKPSADPGEVLGEEFVVRVVERIGSPVQKSCSGGGAELVAQGLENLSPISRIFGRVAEIPPFFLGGNAAEPAPDGTPVAEFDGERGMDDAIMRPRAQVSHGAADLAFPPDPVPGIGRGAFHAAQLLAVEKFFPREKPVALNGRRLGGGIGVDPLPVGTKHFRIRQEPVARGDSGGIQWQCLAKGEIRPPALDEALEVGDL